jgi:hypothetical protein
LVYEEPTESDLEASFNSRGKQKKTQPMTKRAKKN